MSTMDSFIYNMLKSNDNQNKFMNYCLRVTSVSFMSYFCMQLKFWKINFLKIVPIINIQCLQLGHDLFGGFTLNDNGFLRRTISTLKNISSGPGSNWGFHYKCISVLRINWFYKSCLKSCDLSLLSQPNKSKKISLFFLKKFKLSVPHWKKGLREIKKNT